MKAKKIIINILLILIIIYFAQGAFYPTGSIISRTSLLLIILISGVYWIKSLLLKSPKSGYYIAWTILLLVNILGYIFTGDPTSDFNFGEIKNILLVALPFYPFYYFSKRGEIQKKRLIWFFIIMLIVSIADYTFNRNLIISQRYLYNDDLVNNVSYNFVRLIPFVMLFKDKKTISMVLSLIIMFFIIQGAKRGAIVSGIVGFIFIAYFHLKTIDKKHKNRNTIIVVLGVILLGVVGYKYFQQNEFLIQRMQLMVDGDSSGRDIIYPNLFNAWFNSDSFKILLFGHGFGSSITLSGTGNMAHNDWLEILSSLGIIGVFIYFCLFIVAIKIPLKEHWEIDKKIIMYTIVSLWFFISMFSMFYNNPSSLILTILFGYLIGFHSNNKYENTSVR